MSSSTALNLNLHNQDVIAHNLAHLNVPGFKRSVQTVSTFEDAQNQANILNAGQTFNPRNGGQQPHSNINGARLAGFVTDFSQGRIEETGDSLNVALNGDGFFVVQGPEGPLYTRNGNFKLNSENQLILPSGQVVEGEGGPIEIPDVASLKFLQDGTIVSNEQEVGKLRLVRFLDNTRLTPAGTTLFAAAPDANQIPVDDANTQIQQGFLELANTQAVDELIKMIAGMRHFEAAQKTLTTISEAIGKHTSTQTA